MIQYKQATVKIQKENLKKEVNSPLERIRTTYTSYTRDQFIVVCGLKTATYFRWLKNPEAIPPLTPEQIAGICRACSLTPWELLSLLGVPMNEVPKSARKRQSESMALAA
jgi:hypothetical protein